MIDDQQQTYMFWEEMRRITGRTKQSLKDLVLPFYPSGHRQALDALGGAISNGSGIGGGQEAYSLAMFLITVLWHEEHIKYTLVPETRPLLYDEIGAFVSKN